MAGGCRLALGGCSSIRGMWFMYFNLILVLLFYRALSWWKGGPQKGPLRYGLPLCVVLSGGFRPLSRLNFSAASNGAAFST